MMPTTVQLKPLPILMWVVHLRYTRTEGFYHFSSKEATILIFKNLAYGWSAYFPNTRTGEVYPSSSSKPFLFNKLQTGGKKIYPISKMCLDWGKQVIFKIENHKEHFFLYAKIFSHRKKGNCLPHNYWFILPSIIGNIYPILKFYINLRLLHSINLL